MTQVIVDDILLREPNLLTPGRKPVGNVVLNTNHPAAKEMAMLFTFQDAGDARNLIDGEIIPRDTGQKLNPGLAGLATISTGNTHFDKTSSYIPFDMGTGDLAILFRANLKLSATRSYMFAQRKTGGSNTTIAIHVNGYGSAGSSFDESGTLMVSGIASLSGWLGIKATNAIKEYPSTYLGMRKNDIWYLYRDGKLLGSNSTASTDLSVAVDFVSIGGWQGASTRVIDGDIYLLAGWTRAPSDAEAKSLTLDPYQFLIPA